MRHRRGGLGWRPSPCRMGLGVNKPVSRVPQLTHLTDVETEGQSAETCSQVTQMALQALLLLLVLLWGGDRGRSGEALQVARCVS